MIRSEKKFWVGGGALIEALPKILDGGQFRSPRRASIFFLGGGRLHYFQTTVEHSRRIPFKRTYFILYINIIDKREELWQKKCNKNL
jgi:hypothetical protein